MNESFNITNNVLDASQTMHQWHNLNNIIFIAFSLEYF